MAKIEIKKLLSGKDRRSAPLAAGIIILAVIFVLWATGVFAKLWPGEEKIQKLGEALKVQQASLQKELNESASLKAKRELFLAQSKDYWITDRDGKAETEVQKVIEEAAKVGKMKINSMSEVRSAKISEGLVMMELNIEANDSMEAVTRFLSEIHRAHPRFHWQRCSLRPDNPRDPKGVLLSGSLKFVCITDEKLAADLTAEAAKK